MCGLTAVEKKARRAERVDQIQGLVNQAVGAISDVPPEPETLTRAIRLLRAARHEANVLARYDAAS